ncbi:MAG: EamA family transporter [Gammaproteobacteria bacterium]|nr:EamA family transporter [Gammaproteobacteria bacterium]
MQLPWYLAAFGAAVVWGVHYPLLDHALKRISLISVLLLTALPILFIALLAHRQVAADIAIARALPASEQWTILAIGLTGSVASALLLMSIGAKNATLASLIEITYPLFVALFAYALFRDNALNGAVLLGAALIFSGVGLIIYSSR